jgi:hypothetical protein
MNANVPKEKIALATALQVDRRSIADMVPLVDEIWKAVQINWRSRTNQGQFVGDSEAPETNHLSDYAYLFYNGEENNRENNAPDSRSSALTMAIQSGLVEYVQAKLDQEPSLNAKRVGRPLLDYLSSRHFNLWCAYKVDLAPLMMAQLLFARGSKPNEDFHGRTAW